MSFKKKISPNTAHTFRRQVYFLICWTEQGPDYQTVHWRFKLETPGPKQKRFFESLEEVLETIEKELE